MNVNNSGNGNRPFDRAQRIAYLVAGYIRNTLSENERDELDSWICEGEQNQEKFLELIDPEFVQNSLEERQSYNSAAAIERIREKLQLKEATNQPKKTRNWLAPLAAAVLLVLLISYWLWQPATNADSITVAKSPLNTLLPGGGKPVLQVSNGQKFMLDSSAEIDKRIGAQVKIEEGVLRYEPGTGEAERHTLYVPRGTQFKLQLPDGTMVWLNAESSISYPSVMNGNDRLVDISGELFFDVKKDASRKFIVRTQAFTTEVLGTQFNINVHGSGEDNYVFLQEGSVRVESRNTPKLVQVMKPGDLLTATDKGFTLSPADEEEVVSWKSGWFEFKDASIENIMEEVKRWYDVDILYEGKVDYHFNASIERNLPAARLLKLLEMTGNVQFQYKDKTIIVKP